MADSFTSKIKSYFYPKKEVLAVYLFGSRVTGRTTKWSDVDVAVLLCKPDGKRIFDKEFQCRFDLEKLLGADVDVVILNNADPFLVQQVYTKGRPLFVRNKSQAEELKWRHIRNYWDFIYMKKILDDSAIKRLAHGH